MKAFSFTAVESGTWHTFASVVRILLHPDLMCFDFDSIIFSILLMISSLVSEVLLITIYVDVKPCSFHYPFKAFQELTLRIIIRKFISFKKFHTKLSH